MENRTQAQWQRLDCKRSNHRRRNNLPSKNNQQAVLEDLRSKIALLCTRWDEASIPPQIEIVDHSQISRVSTGTVGSSIVGGRNEQAHQWQQQRWITGPALAISIINVRTIVANERRETTEDPVKGVGGDIKVDSNADISCLGGIQSFWITHNGLRKCSHMMQHYHQRRFLLWLDQRCTRVLHAV